MANKEKEITLEMFLAQTCGGRPIDYKNCEIVINGKKVNMPKQKRS